MLYKWNHTVVTFGVRAGGGGGWASSSWPCSFPPHLAPSATLNIHCCPQATGGQGDTHCTQGHPPTTPVHCGHPAMASTEEALATEPQLCTLLSSDSAVPSAHPSTFGQHLGCKYEIQWFFIYFMLIKPACLTICKDGTSVK